MPIDPNAVWGAYKVAKEGKKIYDKLNGDRGTKYEERSHCEVIGRQTNRNGTQTYHVKCAETNSKGREVNRKIFKMTMKPND